MKGKEDKQDYKDSVDRAIAELQLAFSGSPTKGVIFYANLLLPDDEVSTKLNEDAIKDLHKSFIEKGPKQAALAEKVVGNLDFLRRECLRNSGVRKKLEQAKTSAIEQSASRGLLDYARSLFGGNARSR